MSELRVSAPPSFGAAPESAREAVDWIASHDARFGSLVDGKWRPRASKSGFDSINPSSARPLASFAQATSHEIDQALDAAVRAFERWSRTPGRVRAEYLELFARGIERRAELFALLESMENGKPIRETRAVDVPRAAALFRRFANSARLRASDSEEHRAVGVVAALAPWNSPLAGLARIAAPALAAGDTLIVKPSAFASSCAFLFAELSIEIGLPNGVVGVVTGDAEVDRALARHAEVDVLAFSGSNSVGRELRRAAAPSEKRLALELGGRAPVIVFDGADQDSAVEELVELAWSGPNDAGFDGTRLVVHAGIATPFFAKLRARLAKLRVGDALDPSIDLGPMISEVERERLRARLREASDDGAKVRTSSASRPSEGFFHPPALVTDVGPASRILQGELAGPVVVALTFRTPSEAIALANAAPSGPSASIWTRDLGLAFDLATRLAGAAISINGARAFGAGADLAQGCGRDAASIFLAESGHRRAAAGDSPLGAARTARSTSRANVGAARIARHSRGDAHAEPAVASRDEVRRAVEAARDAFEAWSRGGAERRARSIQSVARELADRSVEFARELAHHSGADPKLARHEVEAAIELAFQAASWSEECVGTIGSHFDRRFALSLVRPVGVVAILCPNESSFVSIAALALPAAAMGNTLIVVPSPRDPLSGESWRELFERTGFPSGAIQLLPRDRESSALELAEHDDVDALWYAGPPAARAALELAAAVGGKRSWMLAPRGELPSIRRVLCESTRIQHVGFDCGP